jgi:hypothetical protein
VFGASVTGMSNQWPSTSQISKNVLVSVVLGLLVATLHVGLASVYIDHPPHYDEMYHMLAAESWRATGELRILDGEYHRAALFTKLVGLHAGICGPSLHCARWVSVAASALLVMLVTVFSGIVMRPAVGFVAGVLLAINPAVIVTSQMVRFYSVHALSFFVFASLLFMLFSFWRQLSTGKAIAAAVLGAGALAYANHLQVLTQLGAFGAVTGIMIIATPEFYSWLRRQAVWVVALTIVAALGAAVVFAFWFDLAARIELIRTGPLWVQGLDTEYLYYHRNLILWYAALWSMLPILALLAIARWPKVSLYSLSIFVVAFFVLSIAASKADRFMVFALPFLAVAMAAGIVSLLLLLIEFLKPKLEQSTGWTARASAALAVILVLGAAVPYAVTQQVTLNAARMWLDSGYVRMFGNYARYADWSHATERLRELAMHYPVILSSSGVKAAYYLGDFSFELNASVMGETDSGTEFGMDSRTGRRVVSNPQSIQRIREECGALLVIVEDVHFNDADTLSLLDEIGRRVALTANMWVWTVDSQSRRETVGRDRRDAGATFDCRPVD